MRRAKLRKSVDMLDELPAGGKDAIIGLPAQECTSIAFPVPTADQSLFEAMAFAQLEKRGLSNGSAEGTVFTHHVIERNAGSSLISIDVLPQDFNEDLCVKNNPAGYTASCRLLPIPDHKVVILREHGRLLLVVGRHGRMIFSQILTSGNEFNEAFVQEVNLSILTLQGSGQLATERVGLEIWAAADEESMRFLESRFTYPVAFAKKPGPDPRLVKDAAKPMLPFPVQEQNARRRRRQKIRTGVLVALLIYVAVGMGFALYTQSQKTKAERLEREISANRPNVEFIKRSLTRARMLAPAIDKRFFPMRQLNEITGAMPASGIVIHRFETRNQSIRLDGLARDPQIVFQLKEDLENHPEFRGYTWDMAPPNVNSQNNTAQFTINGKYATAKP